MSDALNNWAAVSAVLPVPLSDNFNTEPASALKALPISEVYTISALPEESVVIVISEEHPAEQMSRAAESNKKKLRFFLEEYQSDIIA